MAALIKLLRERLVYRGCLVVLIATAASLVLVPHLGTVAIFAITTVVAFSLAPLYPLAVSFLLVRTGNHPRVGQALPAPRSAAQYCPGSPACSRPASTVCGLASSLPQLALSLCCCSRSTCLVNEARTSRLPSDSAHNLTRHGGARNLPR